MKKLLTFIVTLIGFELLVAQIPFMQTNSPLAGRYDDISFVNKDIGYAACSEGYVVKTIDGGQTWNMSLSTPAYLRSIDFITEKKGFVGGLSTGSQFVLYSTNDGGTNWNDISYKLPSNVKRVCGLDCVDTNIIYGVGAWNSPAYVIKTTDGGTTWSSIDMSSYASGLVDVNFLSPDTGFVSGRSIIPTEGGIILKTTDGGNTWTKVYTTNFNSEFVWKMQNVDRLHFFASIQKTGNSVVRIAKSTDGGNNWQTKIVGYSTYYAQMIGFVTKNKGWTGYHKLYETNDGGETWSLLATPPNAFNRFHRIDSTHAYLSGTYVYKYNPNFIGINEQTIIEPVLELKAVPNPVQSGKPIELDITIKKASMYNLKVFDNSGKDLLIDMNGLLEAGANKLKCNVVLSTGVYYVYIMVDEGIYTEKLVVE